MSKIKLTGSAGAEKPSVGLVASAALPEKEEAKPKEATATKVAVANPNVVVQSATDVPGFVSFTPQMPVHDFAQHFFATKRTFASPCGCSLLRIALPTL